jgi:hypothetical protein
MDDHYAARLSSGQAQSGASDPPSTSTSPFASPRRTPRSERYGDRYIPLRPPPFPLAPEARSAEVEGAAAEHREEPARATFNMLLRNEVLGANITNPSEDRRGVLESVLCVSTIFVSSHLSIESLILEVLKISHQHIPCLLLGRQGIRITFYSLQCL